MAKSAIGPVVTITEPGWIAAIQESLNPQREIGYVEFAINADGLRIKINGGIPSHQCIKTNSLFPYIVFKHELHIFHIA